MNSVYICVCVCVCEWTNGDRGIKQKKFIISFLHFIFIHNSDFSPVIFPFYNVVRLTSFYIN